MMASRYTTQLEAKALNHFHHMSKAYIFGIVKYLPEQLQFLYHTGILAPNLLNVKDNTNGHRKNESGCWRLNLERLKSSVFAGNRG